MKVHSMWWKLRRCMRCCDRSSTLSNADNQSNNNKLRWNSFRSIFRISCTFRLKSWCDKIVKRLDSESIKHPTHCRKVGLFFIFSLIKIVVDSHSLAKNWTERNGVVKIIAPQWPFVWSAKICADIERTYVSFPHFYASDTYILCADDIYIYIHTSEDGRILVSYAKWCYLGSINASLFSYTQNILSCRTFELLIFTSSSKIDDFLANKKFGIRFIFPNQNVIWFVLKINWMNDIFSMQKRCCSLSPP